MLDFRWAASRPTWGLWRACIAIGDAAYWLAVKAARWTCVIRGVV